MRVSAMKGNLDRCLRLSCHLVPCITLGLYQQENYYQM
jgi:hypothetical protein